MSLPAIQAYVRAEAARGRDAARIGPFLATVNTHSANPFLSYAIPDDGAAPQAADVAALIAWFEHRARRPRLEYLPDVAPAVEPALLAAGFTVEGRLPVMACAPGVGRPWPAPADVELVLPRSDDEVRDLLAAQNEAYGEGPPTEGDVRRRQSFLQAGGIAVLARDAATGRALGGGVCTVPHDGAAELAGIGVTTPHRRRGIAHALTARLLTAAFAGGVGTAFLTAAGEAEVRIYRDCGFEPVAEVLYMSLRR